LDQLFVGINAAAEKLASLLEPLREAIAGSEWVTSFQSVSDAMRVQEQKYVDIAIRLKWFVPQDLPYTVVSYFADVSDYGKHEALTIQHLFLQHFRGDSWHELQKFVDGWRDLNVLPRAHWNTMRDSARLMVNHGTKRCNAAAVVIPAIVAAIEYLSITFARVDMKLPEDAVKRSRNDEIRKALEASDAIMASFDEPARALAFDVLFERAYHGQLPAHGETFNRHKILHGESLRHGTAANALRAFFLVDFLVRAISEYRSGVASQTHPGVTDSTERTQMPTRR
jgi:hypothetical protein